MWGDVGRCGEMWGAVGRCGEMSHLRALRVGEGAEDIREGHFVRREDLIDSRRVYDLAAEGLVVSGDPRVEAWEHVVTHLRSGVGWRRESETVGEGPRRSETVGEG